MSSNNSLSPINITSSVDNTPTSPKLPTPTPTHEPVYKWNNYRTGYTPESKKAKRRLFISPDTKRKIDEIHHFQQQQIDLQRELYFEQKVTARRLSFLKQIGLRFCGSKKNEVAEPLPRPVSSFDPSSSYRTLVDPMNPWMSPKTPQYSPNSWDINYMKNEGKKNPSPSPKK